MILKNIITLIFQVTLFIFPLLTNAACDKCDQILKQNGVSIQNGSCKNLPSVASTSLLNCCTNQCISQINIPSSNIGNSWGNAPEQFGLQFGEEIETLGPHTFFSDAKGYQYVVDSVNERISIQDEKGSLVKNVDFKDWAIDILVDEQENMFILGKASLFIVQASGVQKNYPLSDEIPEVEGYGQGFWQDNADNVYICKQQQCYQIAKQQSSKIEVLSPNEQADSVVPGYPLGNKQFIRTEWQNQRQAIAQILNDNWQITQEIKLETDDIFGAIQFVQQDKSGHFYFEVERISDDDSVNLFLQKYDDKGKLLSEQSYSNDYYSTVYKRIFVDKQGKTRQLFTTSQGVSLAATNNNGQKLKQSDIVNHIHQVKKCDKEKHRITKIIINQTKNRDSQKYNNISKTKYKYNSKYFNQSYFDEILYNWSNWNIDYEELIFYLVISQSNNCAFNGITQENSQKYYKYDNRKGGIIQIINKETNNNSTMNLIYSPLSFHKYNGATIYDDLAVTFIEYNSAFSVKFPKNTIFHFDVDYWEVDKFRWIYWSGHLKYNKRKKPISFSKGYSNKNNDYGEDNVFYSYDKGRIAKIRINQRRTNVVSETSIDISYRGNDVITYKGKRDIHCLMKTCQKACLKQYPKCSGSFISGDFHNFKGSSTIYRDTEGKPIKIISNYTSNIVSEFIDIIFVDVYKNAKKEKHSIKINTIKNLEWEEIK